MSTIPLWGPRGGRSGPVHARLEDHGSQAWCGARAQYRHRWFGGTVEEVTCRKCQTALERGRPWARGS